MRLLSRRDTAVTLFSDTGECWVYASRAHALHELGASFIRHRVGRQFRRACYRMGPDGAQRDDIPLASYVLRDDFGQPMGLEDFEDLLPPPDPLSRYRWRSWYKTPWNGEGAVPGTGRRHGGHYHRRPQTQSDRRINQFLGDEHEDGAPRVRAKRSSRNLPSSWDDLSREHEVRSWKAYRRHQYRRTADLGLAEVTDRNALLANSSPLHDEGPDRTERAFLAFLAQDLDEHPHRARPIARDLVERVRALVGDLDVDLDAPLPVCDGTTEG